MKEFESIENPELPHICNNHKLQHNSKTTKTPSSLSLEQIMSSSGNSPAEKSSNLAANAHKPVSPYPAQTKTAVTLD